MKKYKFWRGNLKANVFELPLDEIKDRYLTFLKSKDIDWVTYYGHETVNYFINDIEGLDSSTDDLNYSMLQDELMATRHSIYPDYPKKTLVS